MSHKRQLTIVLAGITLLILSISFLASPSPALAQCGEPPLTRSSCITCHETQTPVLDQGEWHIIHAPQDLCINCHGGNGTSMDKALAHGGLIANPLNNIYTDCHSCHPDDYTVRANRYATTLGMSASSCATPTAVLAVPVRYQPVVIQPSEAPAAAAIPSSSWIFGGIIFILVCAILFGLMIRRL
ncbi:MAG: hypothetical protein M0Z43_13155 [Acidithiobacillus sp.]|nr:hypothetical protein [Acidithiobacillus sp.]